jgi:peptidyl-prolyl cis-trans isomerase D
MRAIAPWLMVFIAVTFVGWMVFDVGMDIQGRGAGTGSEIARVNGYGIDAQAFSTAVRQAQEQSRLQGVPAPTTIEEQRELEDAVLEQLISDVLLQQEYRRRGIEVTDDEVRRLLLNAPLPELRQVPEFQTDSQFDLEKYQRYLRSGADPSFALALETRIRQEVPRYKLYDRLVEDVWLSDAKLWRIFRDLHDSVTADLLAIVPSAVAREDSAASDADLEAYYREHREEYRIGAEAYLSFIAVSRRPDRDDSTAALERARMLREQIVGGEEFADVARRESADSASRVNGGDLGDQARHALVPEFERAALALRPGEVSQPILTTFGYHLIKLESKHDSVFHARHILIPVELQGAHLDEVDRKADSLDLLAAESESPGVLDTVSARLGVPLVQAPKLLQGNRLQLGRFTIPDVHIWAFEAHPGQTSSVIEADWAYYVFRLDSVSASRVPPLAEVRESVERAVLHDRQWRIARALADTVGQAIAGGADLSQVAGQHELHVQRAGPFTRREPSPFLRDAPEAIGAAFGLPLGQAGGPYESEFAILFIEPTRRTFADSAMFVTGKDSLHARIIQQAQQQRIQMVLEALRKRATVVDRREALEAEQRKLQQQNPVRPTTGF